MADVQGGVMRLPILAVTAIFVALGLVNASLLAGVAALITWWDYAKKVLGDDTVDVVFDAFWELLLACVLTALYLGLSC